MSQEISYGQGHEFLLALRKAGLNKSLAEAVVQSPGNKLGKEIVSLIQKYFEKQFITWEKAQNIMGQAGYGILLARQLGLPIDRINRFQTVPFSVEELEQARGAGMVLVAIPSVSLETLHVKTRRMDRDWYMGHSHIKGLKTREGYYLIKPFNQELVNMNWQEQIGVAEKSHLEPVGATELAYYLIALGLVQVNKTTLWARTKDIAAGEDYLAVRSSFGSVLLSSISRLARDKDLTMAVSKFRPLLEG